jgi:hypothetical protein
MLAPPTYRMDGEEFSEEDEVAEWTPQSSRLDWMMFRPNQIMTIAGQQTDHHPTLPSEMRRVYEWFGFEAPLSAFTCDDWLQARKVIPRATLIDDKLIVQVDGQRWVFDEESSQCLDPLQYWDRALEREFQGVRLLHSVRNGHCFVEIERDCISICKDGRRTHVYHASGFAVQLDVLLWPSQQPALD